MGELTHSPDFKTRSQMHIALVVAQFVLAAAIVLTARWAPLDLLPLLLTTPGAVLAIWAWLAMGLSKIRVTPGPGRHAKLVRRGPYRWIRHPMYTGLLLFTAPLLASNFAWWRLIAWAVLAVVLNVKAREEERLLRERFPEYESYQNRTARFLPGIC